MSILYRKFIMWLFLLKELTPPPSIEVIKDELMSCQLKVIQSNIKLKQAEKAYTILYAGMETDAIKHRLIVNVHRCIVGVLIVCLAAVIYAA